MELQAIISGLELIKYPAEVLVVSDSRYVIDGMSSWMWNWERLGWRRGKKPVMNLDLWRRLFALVQEHEMSYKWVKGHSGVVENERCDALAVGYISRLRSAGCS